MLAVTSRFKYPGHAPPFRRARAARYAYWSDGSESGKRDGLATGLAATSGRGRGPESAPFSVARAGFGLAAGLAMAGGRAARLCRRAGSGPLATAAPAGFGPAGGGHVCR